MSTRWINIVRCNFLCTIMYVQVAVDALFAKRLQEILRICVPSLWSKEAFLVIVQSCLLVSRTLLTGSSLYQLVIYLVLVLVANSVIMMPSAFLTDYISGLEGISGQSVINKVSITCAVMSLCKSEVAY